MALETEGKKVMLEAWGAVALRCALTDETDTELTGDGYARQTISWTYDGVNVILDADEILSNGYIAEFSVPAGEVAHVVFMETDGTELASHALGLNSEDFTNPGIYQVTTASLELDPA